MVFGKLASYPDPEEPGIPEIQVAFADIVGEDELTKRQFGANMEKRGHKNDKRNSNYYREGIGLKAPVKAEKAGAHVGNGTGSAYGPGRERDPLEAYD